MKTLSPALATHIAQPTTTLAYCWRVVRTDGQEFGFTSLDRDLVFAGLTYTAATGFSPTDIETTAALNVDDLSIEGVLASPAITEADLMAGRWDYARVEVFFVDWTAATPAPMKLRVGWIGEVSIRGESFVSELRGLAQKLQQTIGRSVLAACDADLGDARCKVDLAAITESGTVAASADPWAFSTSGLTATDGWFAGGRVRWIAGDNAGLAMEIKRWTGSSQVAELVLPMPFEIQAGDEFDLEPGCDKSKETCRDRFLNIVNFRGFPYLPTTDEAIRGPV